MKKTGIIFNVREYGKLFACHTHAYNITHPCSLVYIIINFLYEEHIKYEEHTHTHSCKHTR